MEKNEIIGQPICFCCKKKKEGKFITITVAEDNIPLGESKYVNKRFVCNDCNHLEEKK